MVLAALLAGGAQLNFADTIQLKDQDAVTGKILTEKPDSVVVDVGYTVLIIPRTVISRVIKSNETNTPVMAPPTDSGQFYYASTHPFVAHDVSSLVKQIGESVVQVRTPEGLGSGFFINADGFLITNFHVI